MNIEVGKFYRTRDGRKARVINVAPVVIVIDYKDKSADVYQLKDDGSVGVGFTAPMDLMEEWKEPRLLGWMMVECFGNGVYYTRLSAQSPGEEYVRAPWLDQPEVPNA